MTHRRRLPFRITLLLALVLIVTVLSAVRLLTALAWRQTLESYVPAGLVVYTAISGAVWTLSGLGALWVFHRRLRYARLILLGACTAYAAWAWADRLLVQSSPRSDWAFDLLLTILLLAFAAAVLLDPRNQSYFRKGSHERKPESATTA